MRKVLWLGVFKSEQTEHSVLSVLVADCAARPCVWSTSKQEKSKKRNNDGNVHEQSSSGLEKIPEFPGHRRSVEMLRAARRISRGPIPAITMPLPLDTRGPALSHLSTPARPPVPPFDRETAALKVRAAEDGWNSRDPAKVAQAYTVDSVWRNRSEFLVGRDQIEAFLTKKWAAEGE